MVAERERFQSCLQRAEALSAEDTEFLADMAERYPYAQVVQMLYLRGLQLNDSFKFPMQLNRTATSAMRREQLMDWAEAPLIPVEIQVAAALGVMPEMSSEVVAAKDSEVMPELEVVPEPEVASVPEPTLEPELAPEPEPAPEPEAKPKAQVKSALPKREPGDISHLPEKVQEQILRSRALTGKGTAPEVEATPEQATPVDAPAVEPVEEQVQEAVELPQPTPTPEPQPVVEVDAQEEEAAVVAPDELQVELSSFALFLKSVATDQKRPLSASERNRQQERKILEAFIENDPKIGPLKREEDAEEGQEIIENVSGLVTETLANHYMAQGLHQKAIQAFEILKLKVPQKSAIFAARISEMKQKK